ncbi:DUF2721 domain-containing protein [Luteimonas sp. YGD11-2]|uniref:DUF2721 domain-containing protein n=1 Tax=Luteimonas sp. YGD11-2 TaxID=2508168 RepID=UPI00100BAF82|nr:DUF2721 domain-containing protein [Luteimonas sp. YGD11-2]
MPPLPLSHYAILTSMLAPALFLTATAALLTTANSRLARVIDRARGLMRELADNDDAAERVVIEERITLQRTRSRMLLRASQLFYVAISCFVGTSLSVAGDALLGHRLTQLPTLLAVLGVLAMLTASVVLAREASLAVAAVNHEMDDAHARAHRLRRPPPAP